MNKKYPISASASITIGCVLLAAVIVILLYGLSGTAEKSGPPTQVPVQGKKN